jgi:Putative rRNA methylase
VMINPIINTILAMASDKVGQKRTIPLAISSRTALSESESEESSHLDVSLDEIAAQDKVSVSQNNSNVMNDFIDVRKEEDDDISCGNRELFSTFDDILNKVENRVDATNNRPKNNESIWSDPTKLMLETGIGRARRTYATKTNSRIYSSDDKTMQKVVVTATDVERTYGSNPTITSTALAHMLWSTIIRPDIDSAIDATAGNGGDSVAMAKILFSKSLTNQSNNDTRTIKEDSDINYKSQSHLLCIDIQEQACTKTKNKLSYLLPSSIFKNNVQIVQASHAPLRIPKDGTSVALIVYNLGYLPQSVDKEYMTTTETTLASIADAAILLRIGGMLSVMTYPRTNPEEDYAIRAFLEGLALFSSNTESWEYFVDNLNYPSCNDNIRDRIKTTLRHVLEEGTASQTWRVHEHKKLGWIDAPILLTATRIK